MRRAFWLLAGLFLAGSLTVTSALAISGQRGKSGPSYLEVTSLPGNVAHPTCRSSIVFLSGTTYRFKRPDTTSQCTNYNPRPKKTGFVPTAAVRGLLKLANAEGFFKMPRIIGKPMADVGPVILTVRDGKSVHTVTREQGNGAYTKAFDQLYYLIWSVSTPPTGCRCTG